MTEQLDMSQFVAARSDQLNSDDLLDGPRTIKITRVSGTGSTDQPVAVHYEGGEGRPFKPCKTVRRLMIAAWGKEAANYVGRSMTLYRDPKVSFGGMEVGGIRVSHMSHLDEQKTLALLVTKGRKAPFTIKPLVTEPQGQSGPDAAEKWTNAYIGKLQAAENLDAIAALENAQAARLSELKGKRPELHERIAAAAEARRGQLTPADDLDAGFDEPNDRPTEPNPETNDVATEADRAVEKVIADAKAATSSGALEKVIAEAEPHKLALTDDQVMRLEIVFSQERQRLAPAEADA